MIEPTFTEVHGAYNNCCLSSAFNPNRHGFPTEESLCKLRNLRSEKVTWVGQFENHLRVEIDRYLKENEKLYV